ncbi:protein VASCULAR ASSOCIATED DEATH 1, chloroplastic-like [Impatiens glandulifera]|uniref:protein VASCULAR ASSOCIATED DEATH 1, chloroplastic-like n=1 Tax=Impatiens glandulifera TaxID=253017 RepID=UPI001FB0FD82|nr:protein VASCULAR ASSOCIATED DEATH 1, chloroplastic-like [Impatiens glandulifera]
MALSENVDRAESVESFPSGRNSDASSESSSAVLPSLVDRSPSRLKTSELQTSLQPSLRSEEYRQLFRLSHEETLVQDFNCALQENFLLQGHMYLFNNYICFYSNLFGFETKKVISFHEVTSVRRAKAAGIFPTAIDIMVGEKKFFFTSFLSRDEAYRLITERWSQHGVMSKSNSNMQDLLLESTSETNGICINSEAENSESLKDDLEPSERNEGISMSEDSLIPTNGEPEIVPASLEVQENLEEDVAIVTNGEPLSSQEAPKWVHENSEAPKVPQNYVKVAEAKFTIMVEEFFILFFSDDASDFIKSYHEKCGDKDFRVSSWYNHNEFGRARDLFFQHPIKIYFGAKFGSCQEVQKYRIYRDSHLVIETSQVVKDVPYGDYFTVEGLWDVERDENDLNSCILRYYLGVAFSKKTMWKGKIEQSTLEEARDAYGLWKKNADERVKQRHIKKEAEGVALANIVMPNGNNNAQQERLYPSSENLGTSRVENGLTTSQRLANANEPADDPLINRSHGGSISSLGETLVKFYTSMKSQSQIPVLLIIVFALILLLMQLSIVVLLSRPQQVRVFTQAEYLNNNNANGMRPEMSNWLDKQVQHLKEEMMIIETMLDKMHNKHSLLKSQLRDLEQLSKQWKS